MRVVRKRAATRVILKRRNTICNAAVAVVFFGNQLLGLSKAPPRPLHTSILTGQRWLDEVLFGHPERCRNELGMSAAIFTLLWAELVATTDLCDSRFITAQEQLAIVVYWLVHGSSQRELQERFQRSGDTISRYLNNGLLLLTSSTFYQKYIHNPVDETPAKIRSNSKWYPYFRNSRGATDGVHILAHVREQDMTRYRDRKGNITQNVLATCDYTMLFTHVMPGYEGTGADGTLFEFARVHGFSLTDNRYYLADAGFPNCDLLMTPYRKIRYHLKEWKQGNQRPQNPKELFNLRHAQLRSVIERGFGVLKRRFRVLISRPEMGYGQQARMVGAAAALHNFLTIHEPLNELEEDEVYDVEGHAYLATAPEDDDEPRAALPAVDAAEKERADARRQRIADAMWDAYTFDHPDLV